VAVPARRGATVHRHSWSLTPPWPLDPSVERAVCDEIAPVVDALGGRPLLIGKSFGTSAAALAADRALPAVWLTPLLTEPRVATALGRATAPFLLVGGTSDPCWDGIAARRTSRYVLEVDADHGLVVPGPLVDTIVALGRVITAMEAFLDAIRWPLD
jgi:hypothetical protein